MFQVFLKFSKIFIVLFIFSSVVFSISSAFEVTHDTHFQPEESVSKENHDVLKMSVHPCFNVDTWRAQLCNFSKNNFVHNAWGYEHSLRNYTLALKIAQEDKIVIDEDVIFAAALLHDMGGFPLYVLTGVDHAVRSVQLVESVLEPMGFPKEKIDSVKSAILHHSYYDPVRPMTPEGLVLHDADALDFLGSVAVMRILSITVNDPLIPDVSSALNLLENLKINVPKSVYGGTYAQSLLLKRSSELNKFLESLKQETNDFGIPGK